jgi:hydrogenase 3 maturation protease
MAMLKLRFRTVISLGKKWAVKDHSPDAPPAGTTQLSRADTLRDELARRLQGRVVIIGIGNPIRGDDAFGPLLARRLQGRVAAQVVDAEDVPESYLRTVIAASPETVLFLDAIDLGEPPGSAAVLESGELTSYVPSTHRMPLSMLMDIVGKEAGARVAVLAVQPGQVELGGPLSAAVEATVSVLEELFLEVIPGLTEDPVAGAASAFGTVLTERASSW